MPVKSKTSDRPAFTLIKLGWVTLMDIKNQITNGMTSIGIEFGSTRIKAVLIGEDFSILSEGVYDWTNRLENGIWTYSLDEVHKGLQG